MHYSQEIKELLCSAGALICDKVYHALQYQSQEERASVYREGEDDTIYQIDKQVEDVLLPLLASRASSVGGIALVAEGISTAEDPMIFPQDETWSEAAVRIIMDPIDGTRGLMYDKRSAFFLAGAAPNLSVHTRLKDIEVAVMTELPTSKQLYSDTLWAIKNQEAAGARRNLLTQERKNLVLRPSRASTIAGGFAQIARFFPPGRDILAAMEEEMLAQIFPDMPEGKALLFEDQYISSGGQLYELIMGHDRFVADLRACLFRKMKQDGKKTGHVCHPYDICATLIGQESGILLTDARGNVLDAPLDTSSPVDWIGYANAAIRSEVEPVLQRIMEQYGLMAE